MSKRWLWFVISSSCLDSRRLQKSDVDVHILDMNFERLSKWSVRVQRSSERGDVGRSTFVGKNGILRINPRAKL